MDSNTAETTSLDYNNALTGLFNLANTALKNTNATPAAAAAAPVIPATVFGVPTKYLFVGGLVIVAALVIRKLL